MFTKILVRRKMLRLTGHQRSETFGILRTGRGIIDFAHYCHWNKASIFCLREWFPKTGFVKYSLRPGQPNVITPRKNGTYDGCIADIPPGLQLSPPYLLLVSENKPLSKITYKGGDKFHKRIFGFVHKA